MWDRGKAKHGTGKGPILLAGSAAKPVALRLPARGQWPPEVLQSERITCPPAEDRLDDVGRQQCKSQHTADVGFADPLSLADLADRGIDAAIEQLLPPPRSRERLDQFQRVPVIARATALRLWYRRPSHSKPSASTVTLCSTPRHSRMSLTELSCSTPRRSGSQNEAAFAPSRGSKPAELCAPA